MESILTEELILEDLIRASHHFFGLEVIESSPIKRGWLNLKWRVTTESGQFLLKQFNKERFKLYNPEDLKFAFSQQVRLKIKALNVLIFYHTMKVYCLNQIKENSLLSWNIARAN